MHSGAQVVVTAVLVGAGILAYDLLRPRPGPADALPGRAPSMSPAPAETSGPAVLVPESGLRGSQTPIDARLAALEARMEGLEGRLVEWRRALVSFERGGDAQPGGDLEKAGLGRPDARDQGDDAVIHEATLATLRFYVEEIDRRRAEEREESALRHAFARQGITLTPERAGPVLDETANLRREALDLLRRREGAASSDALEHRRTAWEALRTQYLERIHEILPPEEADRVAQAGLAQVAHWFAQPAK